MKNTNRERTGHTWPNKPHAPMPSPRIPHPRQSTCDIRNTKSVSVRRMTHAELFESCRRKHKSWVAARPVFVELFERVENGRIPNVYTKTEACRLIGCSLRWAEKIVADTARKPRPTTANHNAQDSENDPEILEMPTNQEFVSDIARYAASKLRRLLTRGDWDRYRKICGLLATHFAHVRTIDHADNLNGAQRS